MDIPMDILDYCESCWKWDDDVRQQVYLKILELPEGTEINKHWCVVTYTNLLISEKRTEKRRRELERENAEAIRGHFYEDNQAADPADVLEAIEEMDDRMDQLSPLVKQTMMRYYVEGLTIEDIAALEWVEPNAVYKRLERGRMILKGESNE